MNLHSIRLSNFQSFGPEPTEVTFENMTYLIGPNGSGKTAILQALCKMFSVEPSKRHVCKSDFHVPVDETAIPEERSLWIEADFRFPELNEEEENTTVAPHFSHMRLDVGSEDPRVRFRLSATIGIDGDIEEKLEYVLDVDDCANPLTTQVVPRSERNYIQMYYLPARRDPADHITYGTNAILGRLLRSVKWSNERDTISGLASQISEDLGSNLSIQNLNEKLKSMWSQLHKGFFFTDPKLTFISSEMESLFRHLSISFSPGHAENLVDYTRLSDGQKSLLYLSLVLTMQEIGRNNLQHGDQDSFDQTKLHPPVFTLVAVEEPENSLSPHYLGRIIKALKSMSSHEDAQAIIATHAPSILKRVEPEQIRHLRLTKKRTSKITQIELPTNTDEAYKYVRGAVLAYPELYFSRLVVLGEGDSEEIVLPRLFNVEGVAIDESAICVAPLGGRHVNHFWRLLTSLEIPFITLLDLDLARFGGGWGRIKYVNDQLGKYNPTKKLSNDFVIPEWNSDEKKILDDLSCLNELETRDVFFSSPMDLDFSMIRAFPKEYDVEKSVPECDTIKSVLGKAVHNESQYSSEVLEYFESYHQKFKLGSKPAAHLEALSKISDSLFAYARSL